MIDDNIFTAFFYLGIGEIFGCFAMGLIGDQKEKLRFIFNIIYYDKSYYDVFSPILNWLYIGNFIQCVI